MFCMFPQDMTTVSSYILEAIVWLCMVEDNNKSLNLLIATFSKLWQAWHNSSFSQGIRTMRMLIDHNAKSTVRSTYCSLSMLLVCQTFHLTYRNELPHARQEVLQQRLMNNAIYLWQQFSQRSDDSVVSEFSSLPTSSRIKLFDIIWPYQPA